MPSLLWASLAAQLALLLLALSVPVPRGLAAAAAAGLLGVSLGLTALVLSVERRLRAQERESQAALAEAARHEKAQFLAQLSQEVRAPLNAVIGMTQLTLQTPLSAEQRELLGKADAASRGLLGLLVDTLDVMRLEAGQTQLARQPLRLEDVAGQAIEQVRQLHANPAVSLACDWADATLLGARGQLIGDGPRLQQALVHLLAQALVSATAGQVLLRLAADPSDADARVPLRILVQHSVPGPAGGTRPPAEPASGFGDSLGLGVARRLVQLMGGQLDSQGEPGHGHGFELRLTLPRNPAAITPAQLPSLRLLLAKPAGAGQASTLALMQHLGLAAGVTPSADAQQTIDAIAQARAAGRPFDWLLLDWKLPGPGPTGADLLAHLRREHPGLRIGVLAPPGPDGEPAAARAFGARAVCPEPLLPTDLRRLLTDTPQAPVPPQPEGTPRLGLAGLRVLLVEDHPVNQEIAVRLLSGCGARVDVAANGQLGLDRLLAAGPEAYDVVLMDLQMPVLDGLAATRRLRELPGFARLPVVAMTAHAMPEDEARCLDAGMQAHIAKPLHLGRLLRELQRYLPAPPLADERPVLDVARGLRQFDGQRGLYERTLRGFAEQYADGLAQGPAWLAEGAWAELRRAAHTLQGLAATLGADPLHGAARELERSAALADAVSAGPQLLRVQDALRAALSTIHAALEVAASTPPVPPAPAAASTGTARLGDLRELLTQSDSLALDWWQAHGPNAGLAPAQRHAVDRALAELDFEAALAALGPPSGDTA